MVEVGDLGIRCTPRPTSTDTPLTQGTSGGDDSNLASPSPSADAFLRFSYIDSNDTPLHEPIVYRSRLSLSATDGMTTAPTTT